MMAGVGGVRFDTGGVPGCFRFNGTVKPCGFGNGDGGRAGGGGGTVAFGFVGFSFCSSLRTGVDGLFRFASSTASFALRSISF